MIRRLIIAAAATSLAYFAGAGVALADAADPFADATPMAADDLGQERAGFITEGGVTLGFGATVSTTIDGQLGLVTTLTVDNQGTKTSTWVNPELQNATTVSGANSGQTLSSLTGLDLQGLQNVTGVVLKGSDGVTALLSNLNSGTIQNVVVNTADGHTIMQNTDLTVTLPGFSATQAQMMQSNFALQLADIMHLTQLASVPH